MKKSILIFISSVICLNLFSQEMIYPSFYDTKTFGNTIIIEPTIGSLIRMIHQNLDNWKQELTERQYHYASDMSDTQLVAFETGYDAFRNKAHHLYKKDFSGVFIQFLSIMDGQIENNNFFDNLLSNIPFKGYKYGGDLSVNFHGKDAKYDTYEVKYQNRTYGLFVSRSNSRIEICLKWFKEAN